MQTGAGKCQVFVDERMSKIKYSRASAQLIDLTQAALSHWTF
jgi:hypothetical protein